MGGKDIIFIIISYLLGCINTGYYYMRLRFKQDIRSIGTNVTGAMNVSRVAGKKGFIITFLGDALKGALVVLLSRLLEFEDIITMVGILMVIIGHIFPFQLKFKGGKGLSTAFGALLVFQPLWIIYLLISCIIIFPLIRRFTITSLFAFMILPLELFISDYSWQEILFTLTYAVVIIYACRSNLKEYIQDKAYQKRKRRAKK